MRPGRAHGVALRPDDLAYMCHDGRVIWLTHSTVPLACHIITMGDEDRGALEAACRAVLNEIGFHRIVGEVS